MSKADEMFFNTKFINKQEIVFKGRTTKIIYEDEFNNYYIKFYMREKEIKINADLNLKELKAINEKVKELGWLDE